MKLTWIPGLLLMTLTGLVHSAGWWTKEQYRVAEPERPCRRNNECRLDLGEVCWWLYDGCYLGQCMCPPNTHIKTPATGTCIPVRFGDEACESGDRCGSRADMICRNRTCQCLEGRLHKSRQWCILPNQKLLGERCSPSHACIQVTHFGTISEQDTHCSSVHRVCNCNHGFRRDLETCRKLQLGESGCTKAFHCEGGAICVDGVCSCPIGYKPVAGQTKCAKLGALNELPLEYTCNEIREEAYCAYGLVCHQCRREVDNKCVRYNLYQSPSPRPVQTNISPRTTPPLASLYILLLVASCTELQYR